MRVRWHPRAREDLRDFPEQVQQEVKNSVNALEEKGLSLSSIGIASGKDLMLWRIKVKPKGNEAVDHRVILDLEDDMFILYGVWDRDDAYSTEMWGAVHRRR